jgi:DHA2 family methylenomycin A resistance protein-like MFS transporter
VTRGSQPRSTTEPAASRRDHTQPTEPGNTTPPILAGLTLAAVGAAVLATAGTATSLAVIVGGSVLLGLVSLAMPAMTAVVVGAAGPEHAGVASGILNAARQSGGALGVALLGSLLGSGRALSLHVPLAVAAGGYLVALALAWIAIRSRS